MSGRSTDWFIGSAISTVGILYVLHLIGVGSCSGKGGITQEAQEKSRPQTQGELCTCTTNGRPWYYMEVYAVGHGHGQKLRRDIFIYNSRGGMQPIDHTMVVSGITYFWKEGKKQGYIYADDDADLPAREYFVLEEFKLNCRPSLIDDSKFSVPRGIEWITPQGRKPPH